MSIVERKSLSRLSTGALIYILSLPQSVSHITTLPSSPVDSHILHVRFLPVVVRNGFSPHNPSLAHCTKCTSSRLPNPIESAAEGALVLAK
jgi:hypothetical protein